MDTEEGSFGDPAAQIYGSSSRSRGASGNYTSITGLMLTEESASKFRSPEEKVVDRDFFNKFADDLDESKF
ncbi:hypothetical protein HDU97_008733 [Phlyctochytrium planicorne]|nr:hypothetical protein HDU97_008733 [Phlyctochytrium planicorne]